jgi:hypothetical protein
MADTDLPNGFGAIDRPSGPSRPPRPIASPFGALQTPGFNVQPDTASTNPMSMLASFVPSKQDVADSLGGPVDAMAWLLHRMGLPVPGSVQPADALTQRINGNPDVWRPSARVPTPRPGGDPKPQMMKLIITPEADPQKAGRFTARLESTGDDIVANARQPLVDGARELLARGFDPGTPLTMRVEGKAYDSFQPLSIGECAKWSYAEGEKTPLQRQRWKPREMPIAACPEEQKSGVGAPIVPNPHPEANSLLRRDPMMPHWPQSSPRGLSPLAS